MVIRDDATFYELIRSEGVFDAFCDKLRDKNIERLVRAAKKGNMVPLAKQIIEDEYCIRNIHCSLLTEKERGEIMNICFNLIRLKKFPKNSEEMELSRVWRLKREFRINGWSHERNEEEEFKDDGDGGSKKAEAIKVKAKKIN